MTKTATATATKNDKSNENALNAPKCTMFGSAKENHPSCTACAKKFDARNKACLELTRKNVKKIPVKKIAGSHLDCFNASINSDTHLFIKEIYKTPCTMKAIKQMSWNKRSNTFYCKFAQLQKAGDAVKNKKSKTLSLSAKGKKKFAAWIESQKAEKKAVNG